MKLRYISLFLVSALFAFQASADTLSLRKDHPDKYIVKKGDTLWDISGRFLTKPWLWPRLWDMNKQIKNPHWIYPGDRLRLKWVNGQPKLVLEQSDAREGKHHIKLAPKVRIEENQSPVSTVELSEISQFLRADMVADMNTDLEHVPYVLGENNDTSIFMSKGQTIHVRGKPDLNTNYGVYRVGNTYKDDQTGEELGRQLELVGVVQPKAIGDNNISAVDVVSSFSEIRRGDRLLPMLSESSIDAFFIPEPGNLTKPAHIIDIPMKSTYVGKYDTVIIDKGARENLKPGDVFGIVRPGAEVVDNGPDHVSYQQDSSIGQKLMNKQSTVLSADHIGEVMVIKVYQKTSLAIVMNSRDMVRAGYAVENP
ncbi:LysM peptidoglycan-binding domain-containing protein [uncultured Tolumonas sp.]|uniref:LysM peptidoglycan-binding domain-containing protein n=1 Tax=uncultured Tolumonas sp. TaxID=263765 RepID=UPI00292FF56D|nr:LysM peptidoglycan-binding domain-containing protein [uncultured Tolumonas sp.]